MARKKAYEIEIKNLKIRSNNIEDFDFLLDILSKAAALERANKHLQPSEDILHLRDSILLQLGEQV